MQTNYFHKECNKTSRKYFEDFDLLPREVKELLWFSPRMPGPDELKEAWKLAGELFNLETLMMTTNSFETERKEEQAARNRREREERKAANHRSRFNRRYGVATFKYVKQLRDVDPKQARLVMRVTEEELARRLVSREENKDIQPASKYVVFQKFTGYTKKESKAEISPDKKVIKQDLTKQWHNS
jgi:hypothetical protein